MEIPYQGGPLVPGDQVLFILELGETPFVGSLLNQEWIRIIPERQVCGDYGNPTSGRAISSQRQGAIHSRGGRNSIRGESFESGMN